MVLVQLGSMGRGIGGLPSHRYLAFLSLASKWFDKGGVYLLSLLLKDSSNNPMTKFSLDLILRMQRGPIQHLFHVNGKSPVVNDCTT